MLEVMSVPICKTLSETLARKTEFWFFFFLKDSECGAQAELPLRQAQLCACFAVLQVSRGIPPAPGWSSQECPTLQRGGRDV